MNYLEHLKQTTGMPRDLARASDLVGGYGGAELSKFFDKIKSSAPSDVPYGYGTLAGAAAGAVIGAAKGHGWVGAAAGASLGHNLPALARPGDRRIALVNMGETGFAVACSLASKGHPFWGFVVGRLIAGAVSHFANLRG